MVPDRGKLPAEATERFCVYCFKVIRRREGEALRKWKKRKTCGGYHCRYIRSQGRPVLDTTPNKIIKAYVATVRKEPEPKFPKIDEVQWSIQPDFSKHNLKEKPSTMLKFLPAPTHVFRDDNV